MIHPQTSCCHPLPLRLTYGHWYMFPLLGCPFPSIPFHPSVLSADIIFCGGLGRKNALFSSILTHTVLQTSDVWVFTPSNSPTPAGGPTIQFISNTSQSYHRHHRLRAQPHRTTRVHPPQAAVTSLVCYLCFSPTGCKYKFPMTPSLGSIIC